MARLTALTELIDEAIRLAQVSGEEPGGPERTNGPRRHLGASLIGRKCKRELWYKYRWATKGNFPGRVMRLFGRGHLEEYRFLRWLRLVGLEVSEFDPATQATLWHHPESDCYFVVKPGEEFADRHALECLDVTGVPHHVAIAEAVHGIVIPEPKQYSFKGVMGHYAGSLDGKIRGFGSPEMIAILQDISNRLGGTQQLLDAFQGVCRVIAKYGIGPNDWILGEFKTHGKASYDKLVAADSVEVVKPEHYAQMMQYCDEHKLPGALYCAVNKDTDDLYFEFIPSDAVTASENVEKATEIIHSRQPPRRMSESPSWYECKFCDERPICHFGAPMQRHCRTCTHSVPVEEGRWYCSLYSRLIPKEFEIQGCANQTMITD